MKLKRLFTIIVIVIAIYAVIGTALRSIYVPPVMMYHQIAEYPGDDNLLVSSESFEKHMKFLRDNEYSVIPLDELISRIKSNLEMPDKVVAVTFDDGYEDNYKNAYPILKKYDIPATIFIITDYIGKDNYLTWDEIRRMSKDRIQFGSHTKSHPFLDMIKDVSVLSDEIAGSKSVIEANSGSKVNMFCYPLGRMNDEVKKIVEDSGYMGAVSTNPPFKYKRNDVYAMPRIKITRNCDNPIVFWFEISGYYTFVKDIKKKFRNFRRGDTENSHDKSRY